ncbi:hypothetical protein ES707_21821 [subsurface metagenome]
MSVKTYLNIWLMVSLLLLAATCPAAGCPVGNLDGDCEVDWQDIQLFAKQWLDPACSGPNCADLDGIHGVDMVDFSMLAEDWYEVGFALVINEFMASNSETLEDPDEPDEFPDWIEIYNSGAFAVDMGGMYLTDKLSNPTKWRIPDDSPTKTTVAPYSYLVIWADGDPEQGPLHADFKLSADGEQIGLFDTDGSTLIDSIDYRDIEQTSDVSFGRWPDARDDWWFFVTATPGAENSDVYISQVADTKFSVDRGFYDTPFSVTITTETEGATIRYTLDGSEPTLSNGSTYSAPVSITGTSYLRAAAFKANWLSTNVDTQTYMFLDDVITQSPTGDPPPGWPPAGYSTNGQYMDYGMDPDVVYDPAYDDLIKPALMAIPTFSIVTDLDNLFDAGIGIYVTADISEREAPISLELIYPDGSEGFQINSGLTIRGASTRGDWYPEHSFHVFFRGEYGSAKLEYPLFGDEGVDVFDKIDLRTDQGLSWNNDWYSNRFTFARDVFARDMQGQMNQPTTRSRYYHLYLNGQYWGIYQTQEYPETFYAVSYFGGEEEDYDIVRTRWNHVGAKSGNLDAYEDLWELSNQIASASNESTRFNLYQQLQGKNPDGTRNLSYDVLMDFDNYIDYMIDVFYTASIDGPVSWLDGTGTHNWFVIRNRNADEGFKFFQHDVEFGMGFISVDELDVNVNRTGPFPCGYGDFDRFNPQWLHQQLSTCEEYRLKFADRAQKQLFNDGACTPTVAGTTLTGRASQIDLAVIAESARWGDCRRAWAYTRDDWLGEINWIADTYIPQRTDILLNQLKNAQRYQNSAPGDPLVPAPLWPDFNAPVFSVNGTPQHGGQISSDDLLSMSATTAGTIYYTLDGNDPRLLGGAVSPTAFNYTVTGSITLDQSTVVKARLLTTTTEWSALTEATFAVGPVADNLRITEIMYHPQDTNDPNDPNKEFIELKNIYRPQYPEFEFRKLYQRNLFHIPESGACA